MNIQWSITHDSLKRFNSSCEAVIRNVGRGTKAATEQACSEILSASLEQVPRATGTLASTGTYTVRRRADVAGYRYEGIVGYAGTVGQAADAINPRTGQAASSYAVIVHEDLAAYHPNGGKAKFLEDPVRAYGLRNFTRVAETYWRASLGTST